MPNLEDIRSRRAGLRMMLIASFSCPLAACAMQPHQIETTSLADFGSAATQVSKQAELAFIDANQTVRRASIEAFIASGALGLNDSSFDTAMDRKTITDWQRIFSALEEYSSNLASLVSDQRAEESATSFQKLGNGIVDGQLGRFTGLAENGTTKSALGLMSQWAGKLMAAKTQQSAREIMLDTDPEIRAILVHLGDAIGTADDEGLRGMVASAQIKKLAPLVSQYARAAAVKDVALQSELIERFLVQRSKDQEQLDGLATVRRSLLRLADAHSAAAQGKEVSLAARLDEISENLGTVKALLTNDATNNEAEMAAED